MSILNANAKFNVGQIIYHKLFNYRGVIIDVDPCFQGTEEWYEQMTSTNPPKDMPWYHVLVDNSDRQTYVSERNLESDDSLQPVNHPLVDKVFSHFQDGVYHADQHSH
ncbi:MAG: heat shock protein HspQ [Gammaproteobacteria bacterium]|nr:heat shock protein HspQ [Gammaproteobacteria bacterium]